MKQTGQTLVELVISITLIVLIITAVTILTVNGLKNSQLSRNQVQATKLAQEGIEKMRTLRDSNQTVCGWSTNTTAVSSTGLWGTVCPAGCQYSFQFLNGTCGSTAVTAPWIKFTSTPETVSIGGVNFQRTITVTDGKDLTNTVNANVKEITVTVSWKDSSGSHSSKVSSILTKI
jgi:type II secretory pathway pseudopilin PulG